jgi:hypothetical protein
MRFPVRHKNGFHTGILVTGLNHQRFSDTLALITGALLSAGRTHSRYRQKNALINK